MSFRSLVFFKYYNPFKLRRKTMGGGNAPWSFKRSPSLGTSHSFPSALRGSLTIAEKMVIRPQMSRLEKMSRLVLKRSKKKTWGNNIWRPANFVGRISEEVLLENLWNHTNLYKSPLNVGSSRALIASSGGSTCSIGRPRRKKTVRSQPPQSHPAG